MKTKEKDLKRNLTLGELQAELLQLREKHFKLRFKHRVTPLGNPLEVRTLRRDMARLQTWIREKGLSSPQEPQKSQGRPEAAKTARQKKV